MLKITINSYLIVLFHSNITQLKILRIIFSYLTKNRLVLLGRRTIFTNMQKSVVLFIWFKIKLKICPVSLSHSSNTSPTHSHSRVSYEQNRDAVSMSIAWLFKNKKINQFRVYPLIFFHVYQNKIFKI